MDSSNFSSNSKSNLLVLEDDRLSSIRRRNKSLVIIFFTLIIVLALIIGGIIISLIHKHNSDSQSQSAFNPGQAVREFCAAPSPDSSFTCAVVLYYSIKTPPNTNPNQIFILSLETSLQHLSTIISTPSHRTRPEPAFRKCSSSLGHAAGQLSNVLGIMRANPDVETQTYEQRGDMIAWVAVALENFPSCSSYLREDQSPGGYDVARKLGAAEELLRYSKDFLENRQYVNDDFRFDLASEESSRNRVFLIEDLMAASLFGSGYLVLVFLFCLLLRI